MKRFLSLGATSLLIAGLFTVTAPAALASGNYYWNTVNGWPNATCGPTSTTMLWIFNPGSDNTVTAATLYWDSSQQAFMQQGNGAWHATIPYFDPSTQTSYLPVYVAYTGELGNNPVLTISGCNEGGKATSTTATQANPQTGTVDAPMTISDTATVTGADGVSPTGQVTFTLYSDDSCTTAVAGVGGSEDLTPGTPPVATATHSTSWTPLAEGTYYWYASYGGDSVYDASHTGCADATEAIVIGSAPPADDLTVTKTATPSYTRTFPWEITKTADTKTVYSAGGGTSSEVNYTVAVTKGVGVDSAWAVSGTITVVNPNTFDVSGVDVTDATPGGTCKVTDGTDLTVAATGHVTVDYTCTFTSNPGSGTNTASVTWPDIGLPSTSASGTAAYTFGDPTKVVNDAIDVTDTNGGSWHFTDSGSETYPMTYTDPTGTCTSHDNTATITQTGQDASATVSDCQGADLTVTKTATPAFTRTYTWDISKGVTPKLVEQIGGTATFNYTVNAWQTGFTDSVWVVSGTITITNPNDWEDVTLTSLTDAVPGGVCTVDAGPYTVPAGDSIDVAYSCTFASKPAYNTDIVNTATANWDGDAASTPTGSASGDATFQFTTPTTLVNQTVTIKDTFDGTTTTLGTLTATDAIPYASATYTYSHTVNVPTWNCVKYTNTAVIVETKQSASQTVEVCGPAHTGALTMGFWQNKNGQKIITAGSSTNGVCDSGTYLRTYAPFQDLSATATCAQVATYVTTIIKAANASGSSMNAMLKAQMLATALDVYFNPSLGSVTIDLTKICKMIDGSGGNATCSGAYEDVSSAFGGATSMTVSAMLAYAASQSNAGGSMWYGNVKATQQLAKDAFDAINNQVAFAP